MKKGFLDSKPSKAKKAGSASRSALRVGLHALVVVIAIVAASVDVYKRAVAGLLPTPAKPHYTFNLRDVASVVQGILAANIKGKGKGGAEAAGPPPGLHHNDSIDTNFHSTTTCIPFLRQVYKSMNRSLRHSKDYSGAI